MDQIYLFIDNDDSTNKYISVVRKVTSHSINEIKLAIEKEKPVAKYDYYDQDELLNLVRLSEKLIDLGANIKIFEDDLQISLEMVKNLIDNYEGIAKDRERMDDILYGNEK